MENYVMVQNYRVNANVLEEAANIPTGNPHLRNKALDVFVKTHGADLTPLVWEIAVGILASRYKGKVKTAETKDKVERFEEMQRKAAAGTLTQEEMTALLVGK